jgi:hypothetical protein
MMEIMKKLKETSRQEIKDRKLNNNNYAELSLLSLFRFPPHTLFSFKKVY